MVGGHPADAFDNAGGTLVHHIERGDRVVCAVLTTGARSHANALLDQLRQGSYQGTEEDVEAEVARWVQEKNREVVKACGIMGIKELRFLERDDDFLLLDRELVLQIADVILDVCPDVIITHWPYEEGGIASTHATTAQATLHACEYAKSARLNDARPPHNVAQIYFMGIPSSGMTGSKMEMFKARPDFVIDCTDVMERKIKALDCIRSQLYHGAYARKRIETNDGHFGAFSKIPYGEPFMAHRPEVCHFLPVGNVLLDRANETQRERFDRSCLLVGHTVPVADE